jgi:hypothetical protein
MSWGIFSDGRTALSSLLDPLLESSSFDPLLESSSLDRLWSLCSTPNWSLIHLTVSWVSFARPSTGVVFTLSWFSFARPSSRVFFTWPSLKPSSLSYFLVWVNCLCPGCVLFCLLSVLSGSRLSLSLSDTCLRCWRVMKRRRSLQTSKERERVNAWQESVCISRMRRSLVAMMSCNAVPFLACFPGSSTVHRGFVALPKMCRPNRIAFKLDTLNHHYFIWNSTIRARVGMVSREIPHDDKTTFMPRALSICKSYFQNVARV